MQETFHTTKDLQKPTGRKENESHITAGTCPIYDDIWQARGDLRNDEDLVKFFSAALERRSLLDRLEEEEREAPSLGSGDSYTADVCQSLAETGRSSYICRVD